MQYTHPSYSDPKLLFAVALITPIVGVIAPLQITTVAIIASSLAIIFRIINGGPWPVSTSKITLVLIAMVIWAFISSIWAIDPELSIVTAVRLMIAAGTLVILLDVLKTIDAKQKVNFYRWSSYGAISGVTLILLSIGHIYLNNEWEQIEATVNSLNRSASVLSIFAWPWALSIGKHYGPRISLAFIVMIILTLYLLTPTTPLLAFLIGACAFSVAWMAPQWAKALLLIMMMFCVGVIPFLNSILPFLTDYLVQNFYNLVSVIHRFIIWEFTSNQILVKPIIGWGLDAARVFPNGDVSIPLFEDAAGHPLMGQALPLHPHNAIIQIWLELGFIGVLLFFPLIVFAIKEIPSNKLRKLDSAVCAATITTALVIAQLGYGAWQGWWLATVGLAAITTKASIWQPGPQNKLSR